MPPRKPVKAKPKEQCYRVPYSVEYHGTADVIATSPEAARDKVTAGDFEDHAGQERINWEATGPAKLEG